MCRESSAFCTWEVIGFCITWPIYVRNLWPASVYAWVWCLRRIILLLTKTMTVPSHPHVSVSTIRAELEKNV
jgi:hypothetical protein